ncbi:MAG: hypothetical protein KDA95_00640 [Acidimicrobiales bacterium]|nr:hypothetical protein [Acidimicrobiales bacterium]
MSSFKRRAALGAAAAAFLGAALAGISAPSAGAASSTGVLSLSKSSDLVAAGDTITINGSGFDSSRGIYIQFCKQPTAAPGTAEGRPAPADCSASQAWVTSPGPGVPPTGTTPWNGTGTFVLDLTVTAAFKTVDCQATGTVCGFVTRNDHRETGVYDQDTFTPVTFATGEVEPPVEPEPGSPTITVTPTSNLDGAGDTVTVDGANIPEGQGVYVRFCKAPTGAAGTAEGRPPASNCNGDGLWVTPNPPPGAPLPTIEDGEFSVELDVIGAFAGSSWIDCMTSGSCGVSVRRDHNGGNGDFSLDSFKPVSFDPNSEAPVDPEEPEVPEPNSVSLSVTPSSGLSDGQTVSVSGSGFVAGQGVYVMLCAAPTGNVGTPEGRTASCYPEQDGEHVVWHTPVAANGSFSTPLTVTENFTDAGDNDVDCTVENACGVFVRRDHNGGASDYTQDVFVPISFGGGEPVTPTKPELGADRTTELNPDGDTITVDGANFRPGDPVFVALCDSDVPNFASCDFDNVVEATPEAVGTSRAAGEPGGFSVELKVRAQFEGTDCLETETCAIQTWAVSGSNPDAEVTLPVSFADDSTLETTPQTTPQDNESVDEGTLVRTGSNSFPLAWTGAGLLAVGAALSVIARRRGAHV